MDLSYAQNLEDYVLWRALGDKPSGFYIDVGGGHPVADNVSCWFYLAGWRGIVVEPQENLARVYAHARPRGPSPAGFRARAGRNSWGFPAARLTTRSRQPTRRASSRSRSALT
jgi:hypothetical protein